MSRIRLNQEYRNKVTVKMKSYAEQEETQEKEKFFQERENFKAIQDKTWELAKVCVERQYPKADVDMAQYLLVSNVSELFVLPISKHYH